jgi:nucleoside-diphosphate-sugar epimerase
MDTAGVLIVGCGDLGMRVRRRLQARGVPVTGVRRHPEAGDGLVAGDAADPAWWDTLAGGPWRAGLLCASPGLRRGRDNGIEEAARLLVERLAGARVVYSGSTAVYADAGGATVDEDGALGVDPAVVGLLGIERAVLAAPDALVLRFPAIVGPGRERVRERLLAGKFSVAGALGRPFSYIHQEDAAELCVAAVLGEGGSGVVNAASDDAITVRDYYAAHAKAVGVDPGRLVEEPGAAPSRRIGCDRLAERWPGRIWRHFSAPDHA